MKANPGKQLAHFRFRWEYLILIALMSLFTVKFLDKTSQIRTLDKQVAALRADNQSLAEANARIQRNLKYYATNRYAEDAARALLGYTKPGETAIEVQPVQPQVRVARQAPIHVIAAPSTPVWQQWLNVFGL